MPTSSASNARAPFGVIASATLLWGPRGPARGIGPHCGVYRVALQHARSTTKSSSGPADQGAAQLPTEDRRIRSDSAVYVRTSSRSATMPLSYAFTSTRCRATSLSSPSKNEIPSPIRMGMIE
jgi:hypothetical protein